MDSQNNKVKIYILCGVYYRRVCRLYIILRRWRGMMPGNGVQNVCTTTGIIWGVGIVLYDGHLPRCCDSRKYTPAARAN